MAKQIKKIYFETKDKNKAFDNMLKMEKNWVPTSSNCSFEGGNLISSKTYKTMTIICLFI